jgi:glycyl-tRNA synthetase beta chain
MLKARALHEYRGLPGFELLLTGFTRAANLLRSATQKGDIGAMADLPPPCTELLQEAAEKKLYEHIKYIRGLVDDDLRARHYRRALDKLAGLSGDIDSFFDAVMVMDRDRAVRLNRLSLLQWIVALVAEIGDLSKLVEK